MTYSGRFKPKNPKKYLGNPNNIIYRSSWELKFMNYCDNKIDIIEWGSEELAIPYFSPVDRKMRRYFPDFFIKVSNKDGVVKKYLVEIKPERFTKKPVKKTRTTKSYLQEVNQYITNQAKWAAAEDFCLDHSWEFLIITEKHLKV